MCQIWLRSDGHVEMGGGVQRDKGTLQLYIVEAQTFRTIWLLRSMGSDGELRLRDGKNAAVL